VLALGVSGLVAGGLWIWLAPRADYRVVATATGTDVQPIGTAPSSELFMSDDGVFVLVLAGLGLLAGLAVWLRRRRRGALTLVALAAGMLAAGVVAWRLGEWAGPSPTRAQLADVGARVTTGLSLRATAALAVGPFIAVLSYLVAAALTSSDDLERDDPERDGSERDGFERDGFERDGSERDGSERDGSERELPEPAGDPRRPPLPPVPPSPSGR
jgi:LPXTG-motif cell wall-anchored protein